MNIYFNWLGKWIELEENAKIDDMVPIEYVNQLLNSNYMEQSLSIVKILNDNNEYYVRANNIIWKKEIIRNQNNEQDNIPFELTDNTNDNNVVNW